MVTSSALGPWSLLSCFRWREMGNGGGETPALEKRRP